MARRGGAYFVAGVFADVGDIPINPHRHLLAKPDRLSEQPSAGSRRAILVVS